MAKGFNLAVLRRQTAKPKPPAPTAAPAPIFHAPVPLKFDPRNAAGQILLRELSLDGKPLPDQWQWMHQPRARSTRLPSLHIEVTRAEPKPEPTPQAQPQPAQPQAKPEANPTISFKPILDRLDAADREVRSLKRSTLSFQEMLTQTRKEKSVSHPVETLAPPKHEIKEAQPEQLPVKASPKPLAKPLSFAQLVPPRTQEQELQALTPVIATADERIEIQAREAEQALRDDSVGVKGHRKHVTFDMLDDSQKAAIKNLLKQQYGCLMGAAGVGKSTIIRLILEILTQSPDIGEIDVGNYGKRDNQTNSHHVPSVATVAFTGRAVENAKSMLPPKYHPACMTIHRTLGFYPLRKIGEEDGEEKFVFVPWYTEDNKFDWDVIVIDEGGMLGTRLAYQLISAAPKHTRIYMVGDINQLPPVHDRSIFGYALTLWPTSELTTIHRQADNPNGNHIIDCAYNILRGQWPVKGPGVMLVEVPGTDSRQAEKVFKQLVVNAAKQNRFDPKRDATIVAVNGRDITKKGANLGQMPLNTYFVTKFNPPSDDPNNPVGKRVIVTAGWERQHFAVGDKVMVTKNSPDRGLTNGMVGFIVSIEPNGKYDGIEDASLEEVMNFKFNIDELNVNTGAASVDEHGEKEDVEKATQRAASHVIVVDFGEDYEGNPNIQDFATTGEVKSLTLAYSFTCHKSQGGEYRTVIILVHSANAIMLYREWLYTAFTRAKENVIVVYNARGMQQALQRQKIKGKTLDEKIESFAAFVEEAGDEDADSPLDWMPQANELSM